MYMAVISYKQHSIRRKFTSQYYINLGEDVDSIINGYLEDLDEICDCDACKSFSFIFKNYCRNKIIEIYEMEKKLYLD